MHGYNWLNETIDLPPIEIMPPVLKGEQDSNGNQYYTVTGKSYPILSEGDVLRTNLNWSVTASTNDD